MGGIGTSAKRLEDPPLLMGKGLFVADINHDNQIYMRWFVQMFLTGK